MPVAPDIRATLAATPFFAGVLSADEIGRLAVGAQLVGFDAGSTIVVEDEPGSSMFVIVSGAAEVTIGGTDRRRVAGLAAGDIVGEGSLLTGATRSATVTATAPLTAIEIGKDAIAPLFDAEPRLVERFAATVAGRQADVDRIYGAEHHNLFGLTRSDLADAMRSFFGGGI